MVIGDKPLVAVSGLWIWVTPREQSPQALPHPYPPYNITTKQEAILHQIPDSLVSGSWTPLEVV